jgi:hypothetical protein
VIALSMHGSLFALCNPFYFLQIWDQSQLS